MLLILTLYKKYQKILLWTCIPVWVCGLWCCPNAHLCICMWWICLFSFSPQSSFPVQSSFLVWFTLTQAYCCSLGWQVQKEIINVSILGLHRGRRGAWAWAGRGYLQISRWIWLRQRKVQSKTEYGRGNIFSLCWDFCVSHCLIFLSLFWEEGLRCAHCMWWQAVQGWMSKEGGSGIRNNSVYINCAAPFLPVVHSSHTKTLQNKYIWGRSLHQSLGMLSTAGEGGTLHSASSWDSGSAVSVQGVLLESRSKTEELVLELLCKFGSSIVWWELCCSQRCSLGSCSCWDCLAPQLESLCPLVLLWGF